MRSVSEVGDRIVLAENEKVLRSYKCTIIRHSNIAGYLIVTNKRILFHGSDGSSRVSDEVVLDSVSGLSCYYGWNVRPAGIILGVILFIFGLCSFIGFSEYGGFATCIPLLIGGVLIYMSVRKSFSLAIYSSKASGTPISIGEGASSRIGNGALYTLTGSTVEGSLGEEIGGLVWGD